MFIIEAGSNNDGMGLSGMTKTGWLAIVGAMLLGVAGSARAAEIEKFDLPGMVVPFVSVRGPIEAGDGDKFETVVRGLSRNRCSAPTLCSPP
ncbi:hypothetical protein DEM27_20265 [Metarhizobium album]|uniref:Uncharacterized protein n=1 Tax=Metarhizobium album TaxID=2182425 RepID=A0A2U2DMB3_9HYPH|nr:hypothetical protein DEM27_20265 [Rhizobium album]